VPARVMRTPAVDEHGYLNGSVVDGTTIETLARSYDDVLEHKPGEDDDRDAARS
jgi:hypothetical protein